jgi:hypothetical protein
MPKSSQCIMSETIVFDKIDLANIDYSVWTPSQLKLGSSGSS